MNFPINLKYTAHDEWLKFVNEDTAIFGISDFAQEALGEIVHVELPEVGDTFDAGEPICEVESVKAVAEVYAPLSCEVLAVNEELDGNEEEVNSDPYEKGWLIKIRVTDSHAEADLLTVQEYQQKIKDA